MPYRPPDDEVEGVAGCLLFLAFLVLEVAIAGGAGYAAFAFGRAEMIDMSHALAIALAAVAGAAALWWTDRHCRRLTGYSAFSIGLELLPWA